MSFRTIHLKFSSDVVDIPRHMLPSAESVVSIKVVSAFDDVVKIQFQPLTSGDWKTIETSADWLASGEFLQQVSIVYPNQVLHLFMHDGEEMRVRVLAEGLVTRDSPWPEIYEPTSVAVRLVADSEVVVVPIEETQEICTTYFRVVPCLQEYSSATQDLAERLSVDKCSLLVGQVALAADTLAGDEIGK